VWPASTEGAEIAADQEAPSRRQSQPEPGLAFVSHVVTGKDVFSIWLCKVNFTPEPFTDSTCTTSDVTSFCSSQYSIGWCA
jgi:hypothetical protein